MKLKLNDVVYPIVGFAVYFGTPRGLSTNLQEAIDCCEQYGYDPEMNIKAHPVALTDTENVFELI